MDVELGALRFDAAASRRTPALLVLVADGFQAAGDDALSAWIGKALASGDFKTEAGRLTTSFGAPGLAAERLVLAGIGDGHPVRVRKAVAAGVAALRAGAADAVTVCFAQQPQAVHAATLALLEAGYSYQTTKSRPDPKKKTPSLKSALIGVPSVAAARADFERALGTAHGVALAREWANRPPNHATPTLLAGAARQLAKRPGIDCQVLGPKEVAKLGMGAFQAVAQGSGEELRFIVLRYTGAGKSAAPVALVGKGITFDSGGISIKPAADMDQMKFDMGGAASVLGVFRALAELKPQLNVVGLIPACENMPDGRAIKPGDVVSSLSGQTIEILNTDAEGRLVLCDALTYAERFKPRAVIDIATLTGACVVALGEVRSGLFAADEALGQALQAAGERALDPCWRMPLDDEYAEGLKTNFADVANVAGRYGGAITAAKFLQRFAKAYPWAHLDIAGTAWKQGANKGATGRPVGLLVEYLLALAADAAAPQAGAKAKTKGRAARRAASA